MTAEEYQQDISTASREAVQMISRLGCMLLILFVVLVFLYLWMRSEEGVTGVLERLVRGLLWLVAVTGIGLAHLFEYVQRAGGYLLRRPPVLPMTPLPRLSAFRSLLRYRLIRLPVAWLGAFGALGVGLLVGVLQLDDGWRRNGDFWHRKPCEVEEMLRKWADEEPDFWL